MMHQPLRSTTKDKWTMSVAITWGEVDSTAVTIHEGLHVRLDELLKGRAPVIKTYPDGMEVTFGVCGSSYAAVEKDSKACVKDILGALDVSSSAISAVRITSNQQLARELESLPSAVGVGEVADLLGVTKQRIAQLSQRPEFPRPVYRLRATPVWIESEIRQYADTRNTRPGRVSSSA